MRKRLHWVICIAVFMLFSITLPAFAEGSWGDVAEPWTTGSGTSNDPYLIEKEEHLAYLAQQVNAQTSGDHTGGYSKKYFKLTKDLNLSGRQWIPIGRVLTQNNRFDVAKANKAFRGSFDGNNHVVKGLNDVLQSVTLSPSTTCPASIGLFGLVSGGRISNLTISNSTLNIYTNCAGAVCGALYKGSITNCHVTGSVTLANSYSGYSGGICGYVNYSSSPSSITACTNAAHISDQSYAGGIAGDVSGVTITECINTGSISSSSPSLFWGGGICGLADRSTITKCYNTGSVQGHGYLGGISSNLTYGGTINNCYNTGSIENSGNNAQYIGTGGIVGELGQSGSYSDSNEPAHIMNCHNYGSVSGQTAYVGGIVGRANYNTVANCYYLKDCAAVGGTKIQNGIGAASGGTTADGNGITASKTLSDFADQTVTNLLQSANAPTSVWSQTQNGKTYAYPILVGMNNDQAVSTAAIPNAVSGLKYTGSVQTGVPEGTGYTLSGHQQTNAGSYTATAALTAGYKWSDGTTDNKSIPWSIAKADAPAAPSGLTSTPPSTFGGNDGSISVVNTSMEYSSDGVTYQPCSGDTISGLTSGTYYVRVKETENVNAGSAVTITIDQGVTTVTAPIANSGLKYTGSELVGVSEGSGYTLSGHKATNAGNYTATASLVAGHKWSDNTTEPKQITWSIAKADAPAAPSGLTATSPSTFGGNDGSISGTDSTMEWSANGTDYQPCSGDTISGLTSGTYYVRVKETENVNAGSAVTITIIEGFVIVNAEIPTIASHPASSNYVEGDTAIPLSISASVTDGGSLDYQWYSNTSNSTDGASAISGATDSSYTPSAVFVGTTYYFCVVTNNNNSATGEKIASATSDIAAITVSAKVNAQIPIISSPKENQIITVYEGEQAVLTISVENAEKLQWYISYNQGKDWHTCGDSAPTYTSSPVKASNDGYQYKCIATSADGISVESPIFTLKVLQFSDIPQTGDNSYIGIWGMLTFLAVMGIGVIKRRIV